MKSKNYKKNSKVPVKLLSFILAFTFSEYSFSWGKTGHRIVANLSTHYLTEITKKRVADILGFESMNEASLWPDRIKSDAKFRKLYSHLHYISFKKSEKLSKAIKKPNENIISALKKFENTLKSKKSSLEEKKVALRFIIHLMGDLHQPLHVGYSSDEGGNLVNMKWFGSKTNLHRVWDEHLIDMEELSYTEYVSKLLRQDQKKLKKSLSGDYISWAQESRDYLKSVYPSSIGKYWEYNYSYKHLQYVDQRLSQAGIRLADILNRVLK